MFSNRVEEAKDVDEIPLTNVLAKLLTDERLTDIWLVGTDGVRVRANRQVLAVRSKVFDKMLLGGFSEAKERDIRIGYTGCVLNAVVEYVHTDDAKILDISIADSVSAENRQHVADLVFIASAALYFELPGLCQKTFQVVSGMLKRCPILGFSVMQACRDEGGSVPSIEALALHHIRKVTTLDTDILAPLSSSVVEDILKDTKTHMDEHQLFELLQLWAANGREGENRNSIASELVKYIHLEWIEPKMLSTDIAASGLVTPHQLLEAYKAQALAAQEEGLSFRHCRTPTWSRSKTTVFCSGDANESGDILGCPPMSSGIHKWTVEIEKDARYTWLGIASTADTLDLNKWLGYQRAWMIAGAGKARAPGGIESQHANIRFGDYGDSSVVTLILDLSEACNGTLTVTIGDGNPTIIFDDLKKFLVVSRASVGFVPAVSHWESGRTRLLEID